MLETKKIFIDTQYFVKTGLNFENSPLKAFRKLCEGNELFHISTSVVEREIEGKILLSVNEALNALKKFKRKAKILSSLQDEQILHLFSEIDEGDVCKKAIGVFTKYINDCKTEYVEATDVDTERLLDLYFDKKAPFGEGKKKSEFPDAISLLSLKSHIEDDEKIYVISDDGDMKSFCDDDLQFISIDTLDKLLDLYSLHTNIRTKIVKNYFVENEISFKERIKEYLESCDVYNVSTWEDAEAEELEVTNIGKIDPSVIYISDEESQITIDIDIEYAVTVTGPDFNNGFHDKEDGRMYTFGSTTRTSTVTDTYTVEVFLSYEFSNGNLENAQVDSFDIHGVAGGIEVDVEENEDWY